MQLLSVLLLTSLSSVGLAAPAGIFDKFCGPTNNDIDCLDTNQNWGWVVDPEEDVDQGDPSRPINFDRITPDKAPEPSATKPAATAPTVNAEEACSDKAEDAYGKCLDDSKNTNLDCIALSDKVLDGCIASL